MLWLVRQRSSLARLGLFHRRGAWSSADLRNHVRRRQRRRCGANQTGVWLRL